MLYENPNAGGSIIGFQTTNSLGDATFNDIPLGNRSIVGDKAGFDQIVYNFTVLAGGYSIGLGMDPVQQNILSFNPTELDMTGSTFKDFFISNISDAPITWSCTDIINVPQSDVWPNSGTLAPNEGVSPGIDLTTNDPFDSHIVFAVVGVGQPIYYRVFKT